MITARHKQWIAIISQSKKNGPAIGKSEYYISIVKYMAFFWND